MVGLEVVVRFRDYAIPCATLRVANEVVHADYHLYVGLTQGH